MWRTLPNCKKKIENFHSIYFILINYANLCIKSLFSSKVINKAAGILIFGVNIPCSILINVLEKKNLVSSLISYVFYCFVNFLCISLFFDLLFFLFFFTKIITGHILSIIMLK